MNNILSVIAICLSLYTLHQVNGATATDRLEGRINTVLAGKLSDYPTKDKLAEVLAIVDEDISRRVWKTMERLHPELNQK